MFASLSILGHLLLFHALVLIELIMFGGKRLSLDRVSESNVWFHHSSHFITFLLSAEAI